MIGSSTTRFVLGLCGVLLVGLPAYDAAAHVRGGFHGGVHFGFGFGCCWGPFGYYGGWGYPYPAYYGYPAAAYYPPVAPTAYVSQAPTLAPASAQMAPVQVAPAQTGDSSNCREYQTRVTIGGRQETAFGYACRQADGSWRVAPR